uniref:C-type lectin domain-containing protein n=1 Tax=Mola mola TaxID=94237 RepID=A0A3Q3XA74_MOLML
MEDELNYATATFRKNCISAYEQYLTFCFKRVCFCLFSVEIKNKAHQHLVLHVVAASLAVICVALVSIVIVLIIQFNTVISGQQRENIKLMARNEQLCADKADLERQTEELTRDRDQLNWTIGVILEYEKFPVNDLCPQKVCKPCLDGWVRFHLKCYLFAETLYYYNWRSWDGSRSKCREIQADLVVIESQEEQEFINNHTKFYNDELHGYWIGLSTKNVLGTWEWIDGSNLTVSYWKTQKAGYRVSCGLTLSHGDPLAKWNKASCDMKNRWICETKSLLN